MYGNPANYTDPSGHFPWVFVGAVAVAGLFNVGVGKLDAHLSGEQYTFERGLIDFGIGAVFGALGYGIGTRFAYAFLRVPSYGILSVGEGMASSYFKGDPFTTNDMAWAFASGAIFAGAAEAVGYTVSRIGRKSGWGIADEEYRKYFDSLQEHGGIERMRYANKQARVEVAKLLDDGTISYATRNYSLSTRYYENYNRFVLPVYKINTNNESPLLKTTIWAIGTFLADSEVASLYKPKIIRSPRVLIPGQ